MIISIDTVKIQEARLKKGYSQKELARKAGVSSLAVNHTERRIGKPRFKTLHKICNALDLDAMEVCKIISI